MTEDELKIIEARADAATPEPWVAQGQCLYQGAVHPDGDTLISGGDPYYREDEYSNLTADDCSFIAHAREDVPKLIAEIRRLRTASFLAP